MGFDWGGFAGSIVGVLGAYGIAVWQVRKQREAEEPSKHKKIYELSILISEHLNSAWSYFATENFEYGELFRKVIEFNNSIIKYQSEAIGTDKRLVAVVSETIQGLSDISKKFSAKPRNHENYMLYEGELITLAEVMRGKCLEIRDEIVKQNKQDF
ncbi:hypothetical protein FRY98_24390 [Paenibacillus faecis]|uniref:Uncharacterized protein n=1 Tax=Paenibacillus faecis TaxID=862114 RepID=A0A5D0CMK2_9BACL|nr:hypothetical protein [Paenibacillus faecis]TYA10912.1 hypothetical protein FRY98_24390 [Paenibacillus faecis]